MSNSKKYSKRLESLFSETPAPAPEPSQASVAATAPAARNGQASAAEAELGLLRARVMELETRLTQAASGGAEAGPLPGEDLGRLFSALTDLIIVYDAAGRYLQVIPTDPALLYRAPTELVGRTMHELMPREKADELLGHIHQALRQTRPIMAEYSLIIDGAELWFEARIVMRTADTVFWVAQDITARKRADIALHDTEDRLVKMTDNVPGLIFQLVVPPDERPSYFTYASSWVFPHFGVTPEQLRESAHHLFARVHPEDFPRFQSSLDEAARTQTTWEWEGRVTFVDGRLGVVQGRATPERQSNGEVIWHGMITDITADKQAAEALRESEERFRDLFENTADLIQNVALDGSFLFVNRAWLKTLEYSEEDLPTLNLFDVIHPESQAHCMALFGQIQAGVPTVYVEATFRTKTGRPVAIEGSTSTSFKNGQPFSTRGVFHDVTEKRRADAALRQSEDELRRRADELAVVNDASRLVGASLKVREVVNQLLHQLPRVLDFHTAVVQLVDKDGRREQIGGLSMNAERYPTLLAPPAYFLRPLSEDPLMWTVAQSRAPLVISDTHADPRWEVLPATEHIHSWLAAPLIVGETVVGLLILDHERPGAYIEATARSLSTFAGQVAIAIRNARLFEELQASEIILREREEDLAALLEFSPEAIGVINTQTGLFEGVNSAAERLYGLARSELVKVGPAQMSPEFQPDGRPSLDAALEKIGAALQGDRPVFEWMHRNAAGELILCEISLVGMAAPRQHLVRFSAIDISERKRNEEALARSAAELASVARIATISATIRETQELLQTVVDLTKTEFALYHAHIYLLNEAGDTLVLTAGAGEVGREMVSQGRRIPLSREQSLVAQAARTRQGVIVNDVSQDPHFLPNPLLPETRAEMAIPMIIGEAVAGVLDVQSAIIQRFAETDVQIMTTLAAQVAVALQNARLLERSAKVAEELNLLNRRLTREGWQDYLGAQRQLDAGYVYDQAQIRPVEAPEAVPAPDNGQMVWPLKVQGEVIGNLAFAEAAMPEDESNEIVAAVADRLSAHLETLRLNEEMQDNLAKQRRLSTELETVAEVTKAASTLLDSQVLLNSVVELTKERFGLYHAQVYLFDEVSETLQMAAGSGAVGEQMTAAGKFIPLLLERSIVARAARTRQPQLSNNVHESPDFLANPLLPETRSELAIPMMSGDKLLGVYDLQANDYHHFLPEDIRIQSTLAGQVAVALQNANLYAEQTAAITRLQELDQLKSSFLANMSHELRTPLNSILGFTDVILEGLDGPLTDRMENDLKVVQKNGKHLLELINDVLDMAKIEAGRMSLSPEYFNLNEVVDEVFAITGSLAREKQLYLKDATPAYGELDLHADRVRLRQVLINVIGNAVKFTETGGITLSAERVDENILIRVKDTGIGIPPDKTETVFEAFSQVDTSTTRKAGGTGLGLPISRRLIELHGGRLWAESSGMPGDGSTFVVELPIEVKPLLSKDQA
jgi:PAS domain S-box-containing protein